MQISLFIPCYVDQFAPQIGMAMADLFERLGHQVDYPMEQTCCGQPAFNSGYHDEARKVARHFLKTFANAQAIVVPSGSCAAMTRIFYKELFEQSALLDDFLALGERTFEFSEFLVQQLGIVDVGAKFSSTATYHDGCHGLRELGIKSSPRQLLEHVEGLTLIEMDEAESCCGFGGAFSVKFPQISTSMAGIKWDSVRRTQADCLISGDPSCLMQLKGFFHKQQAGIRCLHIAEVLVEQ